MHIIHAMYWTFDCMRNVFTWGPEGSSNWAWVAKVNKMDALEQRGECEMFVALAGGGN